MRELVSNYVAWKGPQWDGVAHLERALSRFESFARQHGITDYRAVDQTLAYAFARHLAEDVNSKGERRSHADQKRTIGHVSAAYAAACKRGLLNVQPFAGVGPAVEAPYYEEPRTYSPAEMVRLRDTAIYTLWGAKRHKAAMHFFYLMAYLGVRPGELLPLRSEHVTMEGGYVVIDIGRSGGRSIKTNASARRLPLPPELSDFYGFAQGAPDGRVFPFTHGWWDDNWNRLAKRAGIEGTSYAMRATAISMLDVAPVSGYVSDCFVGHAAWTIKAKHYLRKPTLEKLAEAGSYIRPFG